MFGNVFLLFLSSSCRETAKNAIKKNEGKKMAGKKCLSPSACAFWHNLDFFFFSQNTSEQSCDYEDITPRR
jgi:hypothetical protein